MQPVRTPVRADRLGVLVASAVIALLLSGCAEPAPAATPSDEQDAAFPVTVEHAYGTTEIAAAPTRVVTLGWMEADIVTALGVEPVATSAFPLEESGIAPWLAEELTTTPELIQTAAAGAERAELDLEAIAALEPDLIVATSYIDLAAGYEDLSVIAPVVGPSVENIHHLDWKAEAELVAAALGAGDDVADLAAQYDETLAASADAHTDLAGLDYSLSLGTPGEMKVVNDPEDGSAVYFEALGMMMSETAAALPALDDGSGAAGLSFETVDQVEADKVYIAFLAPEVKTMWEESPVYPTVPAVAEDRVVELTFVEIAALRNPSPLNATYALDAITG